MKFVSILLLSAVIMTTMVDATERRMAEVYKRYDIQDWDNLPEINMAIAIFVIHPKYMRFQFCCIRFWKTGLEKKEIILCK